jgi:3-polyprenyl-4-hydroxybenzoate decarboxylase
MGIYIVSVDKTAAGQGMQAGMEIAKFVPIAKVVIVVDKDIDVMDKGQVLFALGSRWQSLKAIRTLEGQRALITDPSARGTRKTDKIVIDATRQLPEEGGPAGEYPGMNRALLEQSMPEVFARVDRLYGTTLKEWGVGRG